jgi:hypothetical protein
MQYIPNRKTEIELLQSLLAIESAIVDAKETLERYTFEGTTIETAYQIYGGDWLAVEAKELADALMSQYFCWLEKADRARDEERDKANRD